MTPVSAEDLVRFAEDAGARGDQAQRSVDLLTERGYLVEADDPAVDSIHRDLQRWRAAGWGAAADYHFLTYGYPFEHYKDGHVSAVDYERMVRYSAEAVDVERATTRRDEAVRVVPLPAPEAGLAPEPADAAWLTSEVHSSQLDLQGLADLTALLVCPTGWSALPWPGALPLLLKTTPSGGARHPTEVYLMTSGIDGLRDGCYHAAALEGSFELLDELLDSAEVHRDVLGSDAPLGSWVLVLYTSAVRRNWYRYREPRTFRTIHMDVGHLMATCEALARSRSLSVAHHRHIDASAAARWCRVDPLVEVPIAASVLGEVER